MSDPITITLSKPVRAHGEETNTLSFREPTTEDIIELGMPLLVHPSDTGEHSVEIRTSVIARYVVRLGGVPMSSVKALGMNDFRQCTGVVMGFFGDLGLDESEKKPE